MGSRKRQQNLPDGIPKNLQEVLDGEQEGFELRIGYGIELKHGLMGFFPAIYKHNEEEIICFDKSLVEKVWAMLTPRTSKLNSCVFYLNKQTGYCYPVPANDIYSYDMMEAMEFLTREKLEALIAENPQPFEWRPGLIGDDMNNEEFKRTIGAALRNLSPEELATTSFH